MGSTDTLNSQKQIFGHPAGLYVLFFTEMWERFSYYGMRAILVLYLVAESTPDTINPGLNWETGAALSLYGTYTMLVYVASIPGGWIADNILGQKKICSLRRYIACVRSFNFSFRRNVGFLYRPGSYYCWSWNVKAKYFVHGWRSLCSR